jgi:hypothetical protein
VKRARFVSAARLELLAEVAYYNSKEPRLGAQFLSSVQEATARALAYPLTGSRATKNTRRIFLKEFPFAVVYRPDSDGIVVFAIAHRHAVLDIGGFASMTANKAIHQSRRLMLFFLPGVRYGLVMASVGMT